jgi:hypothetical protein
MGDPVRPATGAPSTLEVRTAAIAAEAAEPVPVMQQILENPFLLLFLGVALPTVLYIVWGVMEIAGIPIAK